MARNKLKYYQNTYAAAMAKYGLRRGIEDRKLKHISTSTKSAIGVDKKQ